MTLWLMMDLKICYVQGNFSQKCRLPRRYFSEKKLEIGSYVTIRVNSDFATVHRVYPSALPTCVIIADDVVRLGKDSAIRLQNNSLTVSDITSNSVVLLDKILVNVVLRDIESLLKYRCRGHLKNCVKSILLQYGVVRGSRVNCTKNALGDEFGINRIDVLETFTDVKFVGKISVAADIEINQISSIQHHENVNSSGNLKLGGMDNVLNLLELYITKFRNIRTSMSRSYILLTGPSGCGKTSLIQKVAMVTDSYLIRVCHADISRMTLEKVAGIFQLLSQIGKLPDMACILFLDNLESVSDKSSANAKIMYLLLALLDMCRSYKNIFAFGAASSVRHIHDEFIRPGRFTKEIHIGVPTVQQRKAILTAMITELNLPLDISEIAKSTPGYVGRDLSLICSEVISTVINTGDKSKQISTEDFVKVSRNIKPSILRNSIFLTSVHPIYWEDIGGLEDIKKRVIMSIKWPLLYPEAFSSVGLPCPKGVLLHGPPGCCKTTLVRALATECKATFLSASPAQIYSPFVGDSEKAIIELFHQARLSAPSIIFFDEIDCLVGKRAYDNTNRGVQEKVLSALLTEMDGFGVRSESQQGIEDDLYEGKKSEEHTSQNVIVVAATNKIHAIDDALLRPGRFDTLLYISPPNAKQREAILRLHASKMDLDDTTVQWVAEQASNFTGADLKNLCQMVSLCAMKENSKAKKEHFITSLASYHGIKSI